MTLTGSRSHRISRALIGAAVLLGVAAPAHADALRCGARVVSTGALVAEVLSACGDPVYRDAWTYPAPYSGEFVSDVEEWYYNFGPNQLLRILRIRNGELVEIATDGYGYVDAPPRDCTPADFTPGLSKFRLLLRCGPPTTREAANLLRPWRDPHTHRLREDLLLPVYRERWVYNLGATYLLQIVSLENGRITDVVSGARGSDPR